MNTLLAPSEPDEVKLGQVRQFSFEGKTALGLVFREWIKEDGDPGIWLVCPVKDIEESGDEDPTGISVYAQGANPIETIFGLTGWDGGYAMPYLGGTVDGEIILKTPIVGTVIPETVDQCWRLFRSQFTGKMPDPEKDFWYFSEKEHSQSDWEKSFIVLYEPDFWEDDWTEAYENDSAGPYDTTDNWGPVCSGCQFFGQSHKPCAACEKAKAG